ncbi:MAG: bifunctional folylpolyglutamate synthase/dihydrofolate synthase [Bacteroidetes bacterium]|nr:bifunctional folylpolyglutamate synthase/dihydrofolate synthase [Bacteroidota bacterium]
MEFRTYNEALNYLYSRLPVFQHQGASAYKKDLTNTVLLSEALGNPERKFKSIHVGGTNGKGSVSSMLSAVCICHGMKTGLYTSPHLKDFRERIRIDGAMIDEAYVVNFVNAAIPLIERINPSFFELTVAMAFSWFAMQEVDIAIVEVGLGGRLDSTNIITPELSVITNIGWDHADLLGPGLENIAFEKAGIIKQNIPVVIGEWDAVSGPVFQHKSEECKAKMHIASENPAWEGHVFEGALKGSYQQKNMRTVWEAVRVLQDKGWELDDDQVASALNKVEELSGLRGRWDVLQQKGPRIVADTAHNEPGLKEVMQQVLHSSYETLHMVLGFVKEKDLEKILPLFPRNARYYFCKPALERGLDAAVLQEKAAAFGLEGLVYSGVAEAVQAAKEAAGKDDFIYIGGSTFVVAEAL